MKKHILTLHNMKNDISLRKICNDLIEELNESYNKVNLFKLNIDLELPDNCAGEAQNLTGPLKIISEFISRKLVNGVIYIDIKNRSQISNKVVIYVDINASDSINSFEHLQFDYLKDTFQNLKKEKKLPQTFNYKIEDKKINFSFTIEYDLADSCVDKNRFLNKKILVVEDNELNAMVFSSFVEDWGIKPSIAINGEEAVEMVSQKSFDLILMDIYMPILNGVKATSNIRKFNKEVPIIILTASNLEEDIQSSMQAGANDYLQKPVSSDQLYDKLLKYL
jgi:CheY-like chemotaxis protein